jgi:sporulation protein YlmC with PRC-barrel domain
MEVLPGKDVLTSDGEMLGKAADIKLDFMQDRIWVVVKDEARWQMIPIEQIASQTNNVVVFEDYLQPHLEGETG